MITALLIYDLKVAALTAVCYMFYRLLLERETLHKLNRTVLLSAMCLSLVLPFCVITIHRTVWTEATPAASVAAEALPAAEVASYSAAAETAQELFLLLFLAGMLVRLICIGRSYRQLLLLIKSGEQHTLPSGTRLTVVDTPVMPFSWMHTIVLSRADYPDCPPSVIAHEEAHVRLRHSYDIVFVEFLTALQWFNPTVWFLRQDLRNLHEYEADAAVLSQGFSESQYIQLLMLKTKGSQACTFASSIGNSQIKKRIVMMLKKKSPRANGLKMLFLVPVAAASLALTARTVTDTNPPIFIPNGIETAPDPIAAKNNEEPIYEVTEVNPEFPGGEINLMKFFAEHMKYPQEALEKGLHGRVVVQFVVEKDGSITGIHVIQSAAPSLDKEALRIAGLMPRWTPGKKNGKAVRCKFSVPVTFRIN